MKHKSQINDKKNLQTELLDIQGYKGLLTHFDGQLIIPVKRDNLEMAHHFGIIGI